jgi:trans-aconitate methyltransferase
MLLILVAVAARSGEHTMSGRSTTQHDVRASGDAYEPFVGRWSRRVARELIEWLGLDSNARWLDVGWGTGALTQTILATAPREVLGVEPSEGFIAQHAATRRILAPGSRSATRRLYQFRTVISMLRFLA